MEKIELFLNELSWENWVHNFAEDEALSEAFRNFYQCVKAISTKDTIAVLVHEENLNSFCSEMSEWLEDKLLISSFRTLVFEKLGVENWVEKPIHPPHVNYYYLPGLIAQEDDRLLNESSIAEITERKHRFAEENGVHYLLVNLVRSKYSQESVIQIIREEQPKPRQTIDIEFIETASAFEQWIEPFVSITNLLENSERFRKTPKRIQGKSIYQEISTGYYWYFDNFHRDFLQKDTKVLVELEVFDKKGLHIGTASAKEGLLNKDNRVPGREIDIS